MLLIVRGTTQRLRREPGVLITLGAGPRCDVVLDGSDVATAHASIEVGSDSAVVTALDREHGTYVDGRRIREPTLVRARASITIAEHVIELRFDDDADEAALAQPFVSTEAIGSPDTELFRTFNPPALQPPHGLVSAPRRTVLSVPAPADSTGRELLAAVRAAAGDDGARLVYEDWLEEHGQKTRRELLRLERKRIALEDEHPFAVLIDKRLRVLSDESDTDWRALVMRPHIANCAQDQETCPRRWDGLASTDDPGVRRCNACHRSVHFCPTYEDVALRAATGELVVFDTALGRDEASWVYDACRGSYGDL